jgi:glycerophosphoryl diester phosphodiesterase
MLTTGIPAICIYGIKTIRTYIHAISIVMRRNPGRTTTLWMTGPFCCTYRSKTRSGPRMNRTVMRMVSSVPAAAVARVAVLVVFCFLILSVGSWNLIVNNSTTYHRHQHPFRSVRRKVQAQQQRSLAPPPIGGTAAAASSCQPNTLVVPVDAMSGRRSHHTLIIAHRGASYHVPEHSLPAYRLALELGADFIEPDLVVTSDAQLVAMHTLDLNVTTDVAAKFPPSRMWYSATAQRASYWSFNFTLAEIQTLTLKQRLPLARTMALDGLFHPPALTEILETLNQWNTKDLPIQLNLAEMNGTTAASDNRNTTQYEAAPSILQRQQSGVYIEFKESAWVQNETGMDIVELLYQHIERHRRDVWDPLLHCFTTERFDDYVVPGLVLQSFNAQDLQHFHRDFWWNDVNSKDTSNSSSINTIRQSAAEPNYILLVNKRHCWEDDFWFHIKTGYRSFLSGIGCEKACILEGTERAKTLQAKAVEFGLVLHPWTERPEEVLENFASNYDEMRHMICNVPAVKGFFTESVDTAVRAAALPCGDVNTGQESTHSSPSSSLSGSKTGLCYESRQEANLYLGIASFIMGIFVALVTSWSILYCRKRPMRRRHGRISSSGRRTQVPTEDDLHTSDDLEMI